MADFIRRNPTERIGPKYGPKNKLLTYLEQVRQERMASETPAQRDRKSRPNRLDQIGYTAQNGTRARSGKTDAEWKRDVYETTSKGLGYQMDYQKAKRNKKK